MEYPLFLEKKLSKFRPIFHFIQTLLLQPSRISQSIGMNMKPQAQELIMKQFTWAEISNLIVPCFLLLKIIHLGCN